MSESHRGKDHSGENNPMWGLSHSEETLKKMRAAKIQGSANANPVTIEDFVSGGVTHYDSVLKAAKAINCSDTTIRRYISSKERFRNRYFIYYTKA